MGSPTPGATSIEGQADPIDAEWWRLVATRRPEEVKELPCGHWDALDSIASRKHY